MSQLLSCAVISAVGLTCKAFLNSGLCSITVSNLPILLDALSRERRDTGQGLITVSVSNHLSTLDDPVTWGILPSGHFTNSRTIRWVLGASDIMFTNPFFSAFFRQGQVIETFRGKGVWQPALDVAIEKLNQGHWLHLFGEGKVHQPTAYPQVHGIAHLPRFKWGVYVFEPHSQAPRLTLHYDTPPISGRIIMETNVPPLIIPMWLTGFDKLMPEHRPFPYKYFPKMGVQLGVAFGDPMPPDKIMDALRGLKCNSSPAGVIDNFTRQNGPSTSGLGNALSLRGWVEGTLTQAGTDPDAECKAAERRAQMDEIRGEVTAVIQRAVEDLGRKVSGDKLDLVSSVRT